jgi:hypothetical protein
MKDEILNLLSNISEEHYEDIKKTLQRYNNINNVPEDFYYVNDSHYFYVCRKYISSKNIINIKSVETSLKLLTDHVYNFTVSNIEKINELCLYYPTVYYTYILDASRDIESLLEAIKSAKMLIQTYDGMLKMDKDQILESKEHYIYVERKKLKAENPSSALISDLKDSCEYWDNESKSYKSYKPELIDNLINILNKKGVYKLFDGVQPIYV